MTDKPTFEEWCEQNGITLTDQQKLIAEKVQAGGPVLVSKSTRGRSLIINAIQDYLIATNTDQENFSYIEIHELREPGQGVKRLPHQMKDAQENPASEWDFIFLSWKDDPQCWIPLQPGEKLSLTDELAEYQSRYRLSDEQMKWVLDKLSDEYENSIETFNREYPVVYDAAFAEGEK